MVDATRCIGCGTCARDCSRGAIRIVEKTAVIQEERCNGCGHCTAVCPTTCIELPGYDKTEMLELPEGAELPDSGKLLTFYKFRRSIRQYKKDGVEENKLLMLLEAARFSPTGRNGQRNRIIVIRDQIDEIRSTAIQALYETALDEDYDLGEWESYRQVWIRLKEAYEKKGRDGLFFGAPMVIAVVTDENSGSEELNGAIAAARMEIMANSLGLGVCYIGFFKKAVLYHPELKLLIGMKEKEKFILSFVLGYPAVKYRRTVSRKPLDVRYR